MHACVHGCGVCGGDIEAGRKQGLGKRHLCKIGRRDEEKCPCHLCMNVLRQEMMGEGQGASSTPFMPRLLLVFV